VIEDHERTRLSDAYAAITTPEYGRRWDRGNPGNVATIQERQRVLGRLAARHGTGEAARVLDLGCGPLSFIPEEIPVAVHAGVDLLLERLQGVRANDDSAVLTNADGKQLPFPDETFDLVVLSTLMSSVLDPGLRAAIARETVRVLRGGGIVLWYDFRVPSTSNRATRPVTRRELVALFPDLEVEARSVTVLPPLARRLGRHAGWAYPLLGRVPPLRSHLAACLTKPVS
jgi:SAM-dependent methyltransferase